MFEIIVDDAFARWFETLSPYEAERVAGALELLRARGPALDPLHQSRLLLWFDGSWGVESLAELGFQIAPPEGWLERYREVLGWQQQALRCLEAPEFAAALQRVDAASASRALACVAALRSLIAVTRKGLASPSLLRSSTLSRGSAVLALDASLASRAASLKQTLVHLCADLGLNLEEIVDSASELRELTLDELSPRLRVLYGFDVKNRKLLALLGEALNRAYYGDAVRWAERRWQSYRLREWLAPLTASGER
ncbi:MAG: hypothetical protein ACOY0T_28800 [Myxococcota bacterium]